MAGQRRLGRGFVQQEAAGGDAGRAVTASSAAGPAAVLLGAAAWGSTGTAAHFGPAGASSVSVGAARIVLGGALLLAIALAAPPGRRPVRNLLAAGPAARFSLLLAALVLAGYQACFFTAVRLTGVAVGTVVAIGTAPVFVGGLSRLTGGPRLGRRWLLATAAAVAGCAVLVTGGQAAGINTGGMLLALAAGICYAVYAVVAARLIGGGQAEAAVMGLMFGGAAVLLAPVLAATSPGWLLTGRGVTVTGYLGVVTTAGAYLLYGRGLRSVPVPTAATLGLAEPAVAAVLGLVVLRERLTATAIAGLIAVGLALAAVTVSPIRRRRTDAGAAGVAG
jgi:DME family drug/metabolite transporter